MTPIGVLRQYTTTSLHFVSWLEEEMAHFTGSPSYKPPHCSMGFICISASAPGRWSGVERLQARPFWPCYNITRRSYNSEGGVCVSFLSSARLPYTIDGFRVFALLCIVAQTSPLASRGYISRIPVRISPVFLCILVWRAASADFSARCGSARAAERISSWRSALRKSTPQDQCRWIPLVQQIRNDEPHGDLESCQRRLHCTVWVRSCGATLFWWVKRLEHIEQA